MTYETAISQGSRDLRAKLIEPGKTIAEEIKSIIFTGALTTGKNFEIGTAIAARFSAKLVDINDTLVGYDFANKEFDLQFGINTGTTLLPVWEYHSVGLFTITEAVQDGRKYSIEAIDRMYLLDQEYTGVLEYPATMLQILQSACAQCGITLATLSFANDAYSVTEPSYNGMSCRKIAEYISELAGGYATINESGELEIRTLNMAETPKTITDSTRISMNQDDTAVSTIDTVIVSVGGVIASEGTGSNPYTIANNFFVQNPADVVAEVYAVLNGITFNQAKIRWLGDYKVPLGKRIQIDANGETYYTFNLTSTITFNGGIRQETTAPARSDVVKNSEITGPIKLAINQLKTEINVLDGKIELNVENLENEISTAQSQISVLQGQIATKVSATDLEEALTNYTTITQTDQKINIQIGTVQTQIDDQNETIVAVNNNFDFTGAGLTIRKSGNPFEVTISNSEMDFINAGFIVAYINGQKMYIENIEVLNEIKMAYHKIFKYESGNMTLVTYGG